MEGSTGPGGSWAWMQTPFLGIEGVSGSNELFVKAESFSLNLFTFFYRKIEFQIKLKSDN